MEDTCKDCQCAYTTCAQLHTYAASECKLSDGKPCQECVQMELLDSQISQVHSQLVQLAHKRRALKTKINQRHEPLIHCLPWSVASQIFEDYVHQVHSDFDPKVASNSTYMRFGDWSPALLLSSICTTWRKMAFATSEIWRFINIPLLEDNPDIALKIKLLNECVERSCQRTLFIGVFQFQYSKKLCELEPLFRAIKKIACRSEEFTLWGLPTLALQLIIPTNTPNLRRVQITDYLGVFGDEDDDPEAERWYNADISLAGPLLKDLHFGHGTDFLFDCCRIEWGTITTVTIMSAITVKDGIDILRQAPHLTSCSFILKEGFDSRNPEKPPIVNSTLEKLHIDFSRCGRDFVKKFADSVTLPSIQEFSLRTSNLIYMKPLFERSQCQVRTFSLTLDQNISEDDVLILLSILSSVEHFVLEAKNSKPIITNKFFERLRDSRFTINTKPSGASTNPLLPKLTSLSYTGKMYFTWRAFLEMFPSPGNVLAVGRPLSEVSLKLSSPVSGDLRDLKKLREIQQSKIKLAVMSLEDGEDLL